jgi:hypothetical protein
MLWRKRHGKRHWLVVVLYRLAKFIISLVLGAYFFSFGFSLSRSTLVTFFSNEKLDLVASYLKYAPYFMSLKQVTIDRLSLNTAGLGTWWTMVVGIPLMLMGITSLFINLANLLLAIFDYTYSLAHCPWYKWHKITIDMAVEGKGHVHKLTS